MQVLAGKVYLAMLASSRVAGLSHAMHGQGKSLHMYRRCSRAHYLLSARRSKGRERPSLVITILISIACSTPSYMIGLCRVWAGLTDNTSPPFPGLGDANQDVSWDKLRHGCNLIFPHAPSVDMLVLQDSL